MRWGESFAELALIKSRANEKSLKNHYAKIVGDTQIAAATKSVTYFRPPRLALTLTLI